jgi:Fe-Mn family superoxide dismutase
MLDADPDLVVIDARLAQDATTVPVRLRGARRAPPEQCRRGRGLPDPAPRRWSIAPGASRSAATPAAKLRERGIDAVAVAGGIGSWRADGMPTEPLTEGEKT